MNPTGSVPNMMGRGTRTSEEGRRSSQSVPTSTRGGSDSDGHHHDTVDRGDGVRKAAAGGQDWCLVNWT